MDELLGNADIVDSSLDPVKLIENTLKKIIADILCLLFEILQTDEIKAKIEVLTKRSHALQILCDHTLLVKAVLAPVMLVERHRIMSKRLHMHRIIHHCCRLNRQQHIPQHPICQL